MGQYYKLANLDRQEFVMPYDLGDGLKLGEQVAAPPYGVADALMLLVAVGNGRGGGDMPTQSDVDMDTIVVGRWAGDRIALVGDYADTEDNVLIKPPLGTIYDLCVDIESEADARAEVKDAIKHRWENVERYNRGEFKIYGDDGAAYFRRLAVELEAAFNQYGVFRNIGPLLREYFQKIHAAEYVPPAWGGRWLDRRAPEGSAEAAQQAKTTKGNQ